MKTNRQRRRTILTAIRETQVQELVCHEISDEMLAMVAEAFLADHELADELALIVQHMRHCPDCAQQLADVSAALQMAALEDEVTLPLPTRPFDLTFLRLSAQGETLPDRVQAAFMCGARWMQDQSGNLWINLAASGGLPSTSTYASVTKGARKGDGPDDAEVLYQLVLGAEEVDDLDLEVIGRREVLTDFCTLTVQAVIPSRWPQIGDIEVDLISGDNLRRARTDDEGQAIFREIPVAELPEIRVRVAC